MPGTLLLGYALWFAALLGHGVLWVGLVNRLHALAIPRPLLSLLDVPQMVVLAGVPLLVLSLLVIDPTLLAQWSVGVFFSPGLMAYVGLCWLAALGATLAWLRRVCWANPPALRANHTTVVDVAQLLGQKPIGSPFTAWLDWVPGHEMFRLHVQEKTLVLPRLAPSLEGLSIVHLSDLHFTGRIRQSYFEQVVDQANALEGGLVAVTGDILDVERCLAWLPETLGRLRGRHGVFFVLGNHDKRLPDTPAVRRALTSLGLIDLGGRWQVLNVSGAHILVAGNEWPWFGPRPGVPSRSAAGGSAAFRLLLSHSPDQITWARRHDFDLMLAGHTHGGQIRLPGLGPIFSPSVYGVKYAAGVFDERPTLMHVSRGISGQDPLRFRCPPEITKLVLTP